MHKHYSDDDKTLHSLLAHTDLLDGIDTDSLTYPENITNIEVSYPTDGYRFLHEAAIIAYKGRLFASWYNNPSHELNGYTPIRGCYSDDGGITWSQPETIAEDKTGRLLYCPPVYGIDDGRLYMLMNTMVGADLIHSLELYIYNESSEKFDFLWSKPIPFKLNTNVVHLDNGKLMLPGRIAELDKFPNTPAVLISDSGHIDADWRLVYIQPNGDMPDGSALVHPEISAICDGCDITMFCRDDKRRVPLVYYSHDYGESWSKAHSHDIPFSNSKIYSGRLSDGRRYVIGNLYPGRSKLALFTGDADKRTFNKGYIIHDGRDEKLGYGLKWHYPAVTEDNGRLYIICTVSIENTSPEERGAVVSIVEMNNE